MAGEEVVEVSSEEGSPTTSGSKRLRAAQAARKAFDNISASAWPGAVVVAVARWRGPGARELRVTAPTAGRQLLIGGGDL